MGWSIRSSEVSWNVYRASGTATRQDSHNCLLFFIYMPTLRHSYRGLYEYGIAARSLSLYVLVNKCVCAAEVARLLYLGVRRWTGVARHDTPDTVTLPNEATWNKDFCVSLVCYKLFSY